MSENKVLVEIFVPTIEMYFNVFLPINKRIINIISLLEESIIDLSDEYYKKCTNCKLYNKETGLAYDEMLIIKETDIRNGASLIMF